MSPQDFRTYLLSRGLKEDQIVSSLKLAERFDAYIHEPGHIPSADRAWSFSRKLIEEGNNTEENYVALIRYCHFIKNDEMFVALLELVDGGEVGSNLYRMVGEHFGQVVRDEVFAGIGIAPYGLPSSEKPAYLHPVINRLEKLVGEQACRAFLSASLRDLPDEYFLHEREKYHQAANFDAYLRQRKEAFLSNLEKCMQEGRLFFAQ